MKKFKLIKKYPGSPKLDTIIELETAVNGQIVQGKWCYDIDKTPEFWEEVVEKNYEILSFYEPFTYKILKKDSQLKNEFCVKDGKMPFYSLNKCLRNDYKIHSLKRLSDGEIFTIGDVVNSQLFDKSSNMISDIELDYNKIRIWINENDKFWYLENISKIKQPLFTTEDGVDMYVGNKYYSINANLQENIQELFATKNTIKSCFYRYFSTKESAKEYIILNKPCLSINDVFEHTQMFNLGKWGEALEELVKSKLNQ